MPKNNGPKFNNKHLVENQKADEILALNNDQLLERATIEYQNWVACAEQKKEDLEIERTNDAIKFLREEIKNDPGFQKLEEEFAAKKEALVTEEQARLEEELKNLNEPYNSDIKVFRGCFRLAMDEVKERKLKGILKFEKR